MKAAVLKQPGAVTIEEVPDVTQLKGSVLLKVEMVGLCGSDLNAFRGKNPMMRFPAILGHEIAASVVNSVPGDQALQAGAKVAVSPYSSCGRCASCIKGRENACELNETLGVQRDGALKEYVAVAREKIFPTPLSSKERCLVEPLTVGFHSVARGRVAAGETIAVIGCGGVGLGAVAGSSMRGARTIGIDVDDEKLALARSAGATETINSRNENVHDRLRELTGGAGPDAIIEAIGLPETFRAAVDEVAFSGRVVYIGYAKEPVAYETRLFVQKELDILGSRNALPEDFLAVIRMLEQGLFPVDEAVSAIISLDQVPEAFRRWNDDPTKVKKILVSLEV
jgi:threonine dehydrogenase-like Zn-dependent dehydrogenase